MVALSGLLLVGGIVLRRLLLVLSVDLCRGWLVWVDTLLRLLRVGIVTLALFILIHELPFVIGKKTPYNDKAFTEMIVSTSVNESR